MDGETNHIYSNDSRSESEPRVAVKLFSRQLPQAGRPDYRVVAGLTRTVES